MEEGLDRPIDRVISFVLLVTVANVVHHVMVKENREAPCRGRLQTRRWCNSQTNVDGTLSGGSRRIVSAFTL